MKKRAIRLAALAVMIILAGCTSGPTLGGLGAWSDEQKREFVRILDEDKYASLCEYAPLYARYKQTHDTALLSKLLVGYARNLANSCIDIPAYKRTERALQESKVHTHFEFYTQSVSASEVLGALRSGRSIEEILAPYAPATPQFARLLRKYHAHEGDPRKVRMSLERAKVMKPEGWDTYFLVNVPEFRVRFFEHGRLAFESPLVVGKKRWQTPLFSARMKYVVLNPTWNVPDNIARADEIPRLLRDRNYFKRKHMIVLRDYNLNGKPVDPRTVDWKKYLKPEYKDKELPFKLIQQPSRHNALGRVKFMFPNRHSVYMHDTPMKSLFKRDFRAYSHGCMRLGRPMDMLEFLATHGYLSKGWAEVKKELDSMKLTTVSLKRSVPVHIGYFTAYVTEGGALKLLPDIYDLDKLMKLKGAR